MVSPPATQQTLSFWYWSGSDRTAEQPQLPVRHHRSDVRVRRIPGNPGCNFRPACLADHYRWIVDSAGYDHRGSLCNWRHDQPRFAEQISQRGDSEIRGCVLGNVQCSGTDQPGIRRYSNAAVQRNCHLRAVRGDRQSQRNHTRDAGHVRHFGYGGSTGWERQNARSLCSSGGPRT